MDDFSSKFLDAFNVIEDWMRHELDAAEDDDFGSLLRRMRSAHAGVNRHASELKRLARLRNLIAHNHSREQPLAVPTGRSVERIEALRTEFLSPPLLLPLAASPVEQCRPTDPLGCCVGKMHAGGFSQLPIYDGDTFCGLLTAETIARWLATAFVGDGTGIVEEQPVSEVIRHQEDGENYKFLPRAVTVATALAAFEDFLHRGKRLEAILITHGGRPGERLLGIVTVHDIPKLNRAANG
jgi:predicted transcriptional regulator